MACYQEPDFRIFETADLPIKIRQKGALEGYDLIIISIKQLNVLMEFTSNDPNVLANIEEDTVNLHLSQEQTGRFKKGEADLQLNIYYDYDGREASSFAKLYIGDNLHKEVMP